MEGQSAMEYNSYQYSASYSSFLDWPTKLFAVIVFDVVVLSSSALDSVSGMGH